MCRENSPVPDGRFPVDKTLKKIVELWQHSQGRRPTSDLAAPQVGLPKMCGFCETEKASKRCVQCAGALCAKCREETHSKGFYKTHEIVDLEPDAIVSSSVSDLKGCVGDFDSGLKIFCDEHPEEKLNFYCHDCRMAVCSHCLILGDHQQHQQTPIGNAWETGKETLTAWAERLTQRSHASDTFLARLTQMEVDVSTGGEAQRSLVNRELDHLRDLVETKRQQLLSKSTLEERQKHAQLRAQIDRAEAERGETRRLSARAQALLDLKSEHAFLAVCLPLIQDMKKSISQPRESEPAASGTFRPLMTDAQVRSIGEMELGLPQPKPMQTTVTHGAPMLTSHGGLVNATVAYMSPQVQVQQVQGVQHVQQIQPVQQVQYVSYRTTS